MAIFEDFGKMVSDTYKSATKASGKLVEEGKLKFMISDNEAEMRDIFETLGREYCECYFKNELLDNAKFENEFEELKRMQIENEQARNKILELKGYHKCENCQKEIRTEHLFCEFCGVEQPKIVEEEEKKEEVEVEVKEKVCSKCQAKLNQDDAFCPFCGEKII